MPVAAAVEQTVMQEVREVRALVVPEEALAVTGQMLQMQILAAAAAELGHRDLDLHLETVAPAL
jgi:hypothetical protein